MSRPIVSVVTPCYNGASYLSRYFQSILDQTYPFIELIFIDDGSQDNTCKIAESYRESLESKGIRYILLHQDNAGQAAALNLGLSYVTGEFITWPDSDDIMLPTCLEEKVAYLENHPEDALVCTEVSIVSEDNLDKEIDRDKTPLAVRNNLFDSLIRETGACCWGIAYLVRSKELFSAIGGRVIYDSRHGQNWQLFLPITYRYSCGFIDRVLAKYVVRKESHSRSFTTYEQQIEHMDGAEDILRHVLTVIPFTKEEKAFYLPYVDTKYLHRRLKLLILMKDKAGVSRTVRLLKKNNLFDGKDLIILSLHCCHLIWIYQLYTKFRQR